MECNRDEAHKAKSIAEGKLEKNDYEGAKKFASKAQTMYPCLDGISQMLATIEVYASSGKRINGEIMDWYAVLSVNPSADEEAIRKQYRKLALLVHPDKNKCFGADGAFKLIGQAWTLLSDKAKRSDYDQKRESKGTSTQNVPPTQKSAPANKGADTNPPPTPKANKFQKCTRRTKSVSKKAQSANATDTPKNLCLQCKVNAPHDFQNTFLNMHMLCATCILSGLTSQAPNPSNRTPMKESFVPKHYKDPPVPNRSRKSQPSSKSVKRSNFWNVPFSGKSSNGRADLPTGVKTPDVNGGRQDSSAEVKTKTSIANVESSNPSPGAKKASCGFDRVDPSAGANMSNANVGGTDPSVGSKMADDDVCRKDTSDTKTANANVGKTDTSAEAKVDKGAHHWKEDVSDVWQTIDKLKRNLVDIYESTGNFMEMHASMQHEEYMKKRKLNDDTISQ